MHGVEGKESFLHVKTFHIVSQADVGLLLAYFGRVGAVNLHGAVQCIAFNIVQLHGFIGYLHGAAKVLNGELIIYYFIHLAIDHKLDITGHRKWFSSGTLLNKDTLRYTLSGMDFPTKTQIDVEVLFAYGELIMVAGYTLFLTGGSGLPWLVMAAVAVAMAMAAVVTTRAVVTRRVVRRRRGT